LVTLWLVSFLFASHWLPLSRTSKRTLGTACAQSDRSCWPYLVLPRCGRRCCLIKSTIMVVLPRGPSGGANSLWGSAASSPRCRATKYERPLKLIGRISHHFGVSSRGKCAKK